MSRSTWAAAGASVLVFALTPGAALAAGEGSSAARPAGPHAKHNIHHRRRPHAIRRPRHFTARAVTQRQVAAVLAPGSGYQQAAGSGRVRVLQRRLAGGGFAPGPIDGRYGPLTAQAVIRFQAAQGLRVDGIAGAQTLTRLRVVDVRGPLTRALRGPRGSVGWVRELQRRLVRLNDRPGPVDGRYGPLTERAVRRFQAASGLKVNGIAGPRTLQRVNRSARRQRHARPDPVRPRSVRADHRSPQPAQPTRVRPASNTYAQSAAGPSLVLLAGLVLTLLAGSALRRARPDASGPSPAQTPPAPSPATPGGLASAERSLQRADLRGDPNGTFELGVLLERRGDLDGALMAFRQASESGTPKLAQAAHNALLELDQLNDSPRAGHRRGGHDGL